MNRRTFLAFAAAPPRRPMLKFDVYAFDRARVLRDVGGYLGRSPRRLRRRIHRALRADRTISIREGNYWWPDPKNASGPYIRRDGTSNPNNFDDNRRALMRFSVQAPALAAAWHLTGDKRYASRAADM